MIQMISNHLLTIPFTLNAASNLRNISKHMGRNGRYVLQKYICSNEEMFHSNIFNKHYNSFTTSTSTPQNKLAKTPEVEK